MCYRQVLISPPSAMFRQEGRYAHVSILGGSPIRNSFWVDYDLFCWIMKHLHQLRERDLLVIHPSNWLVGSILYFLKGDPQI